MPEYIYVKGNGEAGIDLAKKFGIEYIFEHDEEAYRGRASSRGLQKNKQKPESKRKTSGFMKKIKDITRGDIGDEGR